MILNSLEKLENKIEDFDERYQDEIRSYRGQIIEQLAVKELKQNLGFQRLLNGLNERVKSIDNVLKGDIKIIGTEEAKYLYREKLAYQWLLSFFQDAADDLRSIENKINENL